jgi:hypothetical protein
VEVDVKSSRSIVLVLALFLFAACGGASSGGSTTAPPDVVTTGGADTTAPSADTTAPSEDDPGVASLDDMPAECIEAFSNFLQAIEPFIQDIDFENSTGAELEAVFAEIEPISDSFEAETANCPELDMSNEESVAAMQAMAERDAPGTAGYFAWLASFMANVDDGGASVSGDCETDIATLQAFVDRGGTMADLTMSELTEVSNLMVAAGTECTPERWNEWLDQDSVAAWGS